jgi:hypothetical protein
MDCRPNIHRNTSDDGVDGDVSDDDVEDGEYGKKKPSQPPRLRKQRSSYVSRPHRNFAHAHGDPMGWE